MKSVLGWVLSAALVLTSASTTSAAFAAKKKATKQTEAKEVPKQTEAKAAPKLPTHPVYGIPVFEGAQEASEKTMRGLGLDAFDGYLVGAFFTNATAEDVAVFYVKALSRSTKKEVNDGTLRFTLMIEPPSGENPLGEKVVIDQNEGGVKDEAGTQYKTLIAVYRKVVEKKPEAK